MPAIGFYSCLPNDDTFVDTYLLSHGQIFQKCRIIKLAGSFTVSVPTYLPQYKYTQIPAWLVHNGYYSVQGTYTVHPCALCADME